MEIVRDKSSLPLPQGWYSINLKYLKADLDPLTKLAIWRNMSDNHIRQHKITECSTCKQISNFEHYIYHCPSTQHFREFFYEKFKKLTNTGCKLKYELIYWDYNRRRLTLNHTGFITDQEYFRYFRQTPKTIQNWTNIQALLSLLVGRCHNIYYADFLTTQKAIEAANRARKSKKQRSPNRTQ